MRSAPYSSPSSRGCEGERDSEESEPPEMAAGIRVLAGKQERREPYEFRFLFHCSASQPKTPFRIGEFLQKVELMGGCGSILTMWRRPESSRSRPSSKSVYPISAENNNSLEEVTRALAHAGLESSKLIVGIDFTKSNEWAGEKSFSRRSLHHIADSSNPYEHAISIIGRTLASFDEDNLIPCFGFGDATTHDDYVFSLCLDGGHCNGFEAVLTAYKEIVPSLRLAGPTSFAPIIEMAMSIIEKSGGQFHVLLIITSGKLGVQNQKTFDVIVEASKFPLSIILVGVGDGPWDIGKILGDSTPSRAFDNLHFVNFMDITAKNVPPSQKEVEFARAALMKVPSQYKATRNFSMSGGQTGNISLRVPLCPPHCRESSSGTTAPHAATSTDENEVCTICFANSVNMVLYCGHQICSECKPKIYHCPWCRIPVGYEDYKLI